MFRNTSAFILISRLSLKKANIKDLYVNCLSFLKAFYYLKPFSKAAFFLIIGLTV